jgi:cytidine deaminase
MPETLDSVKFPELIFGIAGPIGVDIDAITESLDSALRAVHYTSSTIKLTTEMRNYGGVAASASETDFHQEMISKIEFANDLCKNHKDKAALARISLRKILAIRADLTGDREVSKDRHAYIIRQFKRPEEIKLLRKVYGKQFILVSAYGSQSDRQEALEKKIRRSSAIHLDDDAITARAKKLITRDASEEDPYGQQLGETFHLADVFVDGIDKSTMNSNITRFVNAFFGQTDISPNKSEFGMYTAKAASMRSADLSRQVGAALFSEDGEIISQGCNEVPKAFGGAYWDTEEPDYRDVKIGSDPNELQKQEIIRDLFERLGEHGMLSEKATSIGNPRQIAEAVIKKNDWSGSGTSGKGPLVGSSIMDLTEYGRVVHAEMGAICDAARIGRSTRGAVLFCTTFPCHNCTKHILASGIRRVFYMEPYPKSKAKELHKNEISIEVISTSRVSFVPFIGIAPHRYADIFQKDRRKDASGKAKRWYYGEARPMVDIIVPADPQVEAMAAAELYSKITQQDA